MTKRPTLSDVTSLTNSSNINVINQNWDAIQEAFDNTVSRDGSTPNTMAGDLDLNGNALLNVGTIDVNALTLDGQQVVDLASIPEWRSAWLTGTSYIKNDLVKEAGNVYICLVTHTSGTFATDLTALKWELMVSKGDSGAGTGDVVAANNLSDLADAATARANLGLGTAATENTVPVGKGGTGATDAATARTNLGLGVGVDVQAYNTRLNTLATVADPNADRLVFWDDSASDLAYLTPGNGLLVSGTTISSGYTWATPITTTGAASFDVTSIPTGITEIVAIFNAVSLTTKSDVNLVRLGTGGVLASAGYVSNGVIFENTSMASFVATIGLNLSSSADTISGVARFIKEPSTNTWFMDAKLRRFGSAFQGDTIASGYIALGGTLDTFRLIRSGASNYNGGTLSVGWR